MTERETQTLEWLRKVGKATEKTAILFGHNPSVLMSLVRAGEVDIEGTNREIYFVPKS